MTARRRTLLAVAALAALVLTSGCLGAILGGSSVPRSELDKEPPGNYTYNWNASVDAHITVTEQAKFLAVYRLPDDSSVELFRRDGFGGRNSIPVSAVRFRYPNGTVITGSEMLNRSGEVTRTRNEVTVTPPADAPSNGTGKLAFTSSSTPKRFTLPTFVKGSYRVILPSDRRIDFPVFGTVSPGGYEATRVGDRTHIAWDDVQSRAIVVQFYLQRDLLIFGAIVVLLGGVGGAGLLYYRRKIQALQERREEMGLDVDVEDDDFGRDPPPGMR